MTDNVKVAIRCRPLSEKEIADGHESIVNFEGNNKVIVEGKNDEPGSKTGDRRSFLREYQFDQVFDWNSSQEEIYEKCCRPIVESVLEGYNGTIFAYGQTGTGKTYTMEGDCGKRRNSSTSNEVNSWTRKNSLVLEKRKESEQLSANSLIKNERFSSMVKKDEFDDSTTIGVIPRTFKHIFQHIAKHPKIQFLVRVSYLEIYQENIHDLLRKDRSLKLELHERPDIGVYVKDLTSFFCKSETEIERVMKVGNQNRRVGATDMNQHSSRSHAIFMITIEQQSKQSLVKDNDDNDNSNSNSNNSKNKIINSMGKELESSVARIIKVGKLNLIDLAGSESQKKTNSFGERQKESVKINLSLSALGNVINSLMKVNTLLGKKAENVSSYHHHTPYRDSKLTRLLQDSLGGNAKTLMIANIGPASYNYDETINTLNYASRAKLIKNKPMLNEDPKDALLRQLQKEIDELRHKLAELDTNPSANNHIVTNNNYPNKQQEELVTSDKKKSGCGKISQDDHDDGSINDCVNYVNELNKVDKTMIARELMDLRQKLASLESKLLNNDTINNTIMNREGKELENKHQTMAGNKKKQLNYKINNSNNCNNLNQLQASDLLENYMKKQEQELEAKRLELASQRNRESAIRNELEKKEEVELLTKESFSSTQHEFDAKKRLIRQILIKLKQMRDSMENDENTYRLQLDELDQLQYELSKELKLKCLIMDNFIPKYHVNQLLPRISYNEQTSDCLRETIHFPLDKCLNKCLNECLNKCLESDGQCSLNYAHFWRKITNQLSSNGTSLHRPKSNFEKVEETLFPANIRFKCDQFIEFQYDPKLQYKFLKEKANLIGSNSERKFPLDGEKKSWEKVEELLNESLAIQEADIVI